MRKLLRSLRTEPSYKSFEISQFQISYSWNRLKIYLQWVKCAYKQIFFFNLEQNWWSDVNTVYVDINSYNMFLVYRFRCDPIILHRRQFSNAFNPLVVVKPFLSSNETGNHFPVSISFKSRQYINTPLHLTLHESVVNNFAVNLEKNGAFVQILPSWDVFVPHAKIFAV